jgi:hypothetical protein
MFLSGTVSTTIDEKMEYYRADTSTKQKDWPRLEVSIRTSSSIKTADVTACSAQTSQEQGTQTIAIAVQSIS